MEHFVCHYTAASRAQIAFAWNGQHAEQFVDAHLGFRREVIAYCLAHSETVPTALWRDLFWAEAEYSCEAWSVLADFHQISFSVETPPLMADNSNRRGVTPSLSGQHVGRCFMCRPVC